MSSLLYNVRFFLACSRPRYWRRTPLDRRAEQ